MISTSSLISLGDAAAHLYNEFDYADTQVKDVFGAPFSAAKDSLVSDFRLAHKEGTDLSCFQGENNRFRYPEHGVKIVVRYTKKPTEHSSLTELQQKIEQLEKELKLTKMLLKNRSEELIAFGECGQVVERIDLAFSSL